MPFGSFADILFQWEMLGVFDFILPFLLIFAVIFGILGQMKIFGESKGIHVMIAIVLGMLAVRFRIFTDFLAIISPRLGIGLTIILALLILAGIFTPEGSRGIVGYVLMGVGAVIFIIIVVQTFDVLGFGYGSWGYGSSELVGYVLLLVLLIGIIIAVSSSGSHSGKHRVADSIKSLFGN